MSQGKQNPSQNRPGLAEARARSLQQGRARPEELRALMDLQPRHAFRGAPLLGAVLARTHPGFTKKGVGVSRLRDHWTEIVGERLARLSEPIALRANKKGGGVLTIRAQGAAATLLAHDGSVARKAKVIAGVSGMLSIRVEQADLSARGKTGQKTGQKPYQRTHKP